MAAHPRGTAGSHKGPHTAPPEPLPLRDSPRHCKKPTPVGLSRVGFCHGERHRGGAGAAWGGVGALVAARRASWRVGPSIPHGRSPARGGISAPQKPTPESPCRPHRPSDAINHVPTVDNSMNQPIPSTAIILAGGYSRRMGQDKALLPHPTHRYLTFVEHMVATLAPLSYEVLLVVRDEVQAAHYTFLRDVRVLTDQVPNFGPLMGLYTGMKAMSTSHALVVAVDMPFIQPSLISFLFSQMEGDKLLVPVVQSTPQVLLAVYPRTVLPLIEARLQEGRRDPRSLLAVAPVRYIEEAQLRQVDPQLRSFVNVNTPEELRDVL